MHYSPSYHWHFLFHTVDVFLYFMLMFVYNFDSGINFCGEDFLLKLFWGHREQNRKNCKN